jgi:hypothetical protein
MLVWEFPHLGHLAEFFLKGKRSNNQTQDMLFTSEFIATYVKPKILSIACSFDIIFFPIFVPYPECTRGYTELLPSCISLFILQNV